MVGKRKINTHTFCIDPKKVVPAPKKPPTKADLASELKSVLKLNEALEEENKKNLDKIEVLEGKVFKLEKQSGSDFTCSKTHMEKSSQTESEEMIFCYECEYPVDDFHELGEHMIECHFEGSCNYCDETFTTKEKLEDHIAEDHTQEGPATNKSENLKCNHCEQIFFTIRELMKHKKERHMEMISTCWNFTLGNCEFNDEKCWFKHSSTEKSDEIECKMCDDRFMTMPEFHKHRKQKHKRAVPQCKYEVNGTCKFGENLCWFKHSENKETKGDDIIEHKNMEKKEVIERLFNIVENITDRMSLLENKNK